MNCFVKRRVELFRLVDFPASGSGQTDSTKPTGTAASPSPPPSHRSMTGTVQFDVPDSDTAAATAARLSRPTLLRPVSMEEADNSVNEIHESLPRKAAVRLYRQISSGFNSRTIRCLLVVSLGLNIIFAVLVGIFVGFWQSSRLDLLDGGRESSLVNMEAKSRMYSCFPCSEEGIPGLSISVRSQNGVCCTTDDVPGFEQSSKLLHQTRDYVRSNCPPTRSGNRRTNKNRDQPSAAHLTLNVPQSKALLKSLPAEKHYLSWNVRDDAGVSFISDDLRYVNGTITIPSSGRYHVYTHLTFDTNSNRLDRQQLLVDHSITRISRGSPYSLLLDRVNLLSREIKSSDLEGTFEFRKGDVLKVIVSFPSYLYNMPQTNVFGLFKLVS